MLRNIFVGLILSGGSILAVSDSLYTLALYLWWAYFRPDYWIHTDALRTVPVSYAIGLLLLVRSALSRTAFRFDLRAGLLLLLLLLATISTLSSDYFAFSELYLRDFAKSLIVTYLIAVLASDTRRLRLILL